MSNSKEDTSILKVFVFEQQSYNSFGQQLRAIRLNRGLSQAAFGEILGISKQRVSAYELGLRQPKIDSIVSIAGRLKLPVQIVIGEHANIFQMEGVYQSRVISEDAYAVACAYMNARKKDQDTARYALDIPLGKML